MEELGDVFGQLAQRLTDAAIAALAASSISLSEMVSKLNENQHFFSQARRLACGTHELRCS